MKKTGRYWQIYARNCEVKRIDKAAAGPFLDRCHWLGDTSCRYRYGLFIKRCGSDDFPVGTMVAVGCFSNPRRWTKGDRTVRSYEWVRAASLPDVRVAGGMGKILQAFIDEVAPDDIMSYAPAASDGGVYEKLGFIREDCPIEGNLKYRLKLSY